MSGLKAIAQEEQYCLPIPVLNNLIQDSEENDLQKQLVEQLDEIVLAKNRTIFRLDSMNTAYHATITDRTDKLNRALSLVIEQKTTIDKKNNTIKILSIVGTALLAALAFK